MRYFIAMMFVIGVTTTAGAESPLLEQLIGQTCRANTGMFDVVYTIDRKNGQWAVHDLFGNRGSAESTMKDVGWLPATVDGDSLTFQGMSARITLRAKDAHTVDGHFSQTNPARSGVFDYVLTCTPTPADKRWH
jgi:hypothetical protein